VRGLGSNWLTFDYCSYAAPAAVISLDRDKLPACTEELYQVVL
jgi:hypothetical protein